MRVFVPCTCQSFQIARDRLSLFQRSEPSIFLIIVAHEQKSKKDKSKKKKDEVDPEAVCHHRSLSIITHTILFSHYAS
jgi:hypothetical protein